MRCVLTWQCYKFDDFDFKNNKPKVSTPIKSEKTAASSASSSEKKTDDIPAWQKAFTYVAC